MQRDIRIAMWSGPRNISTAMMRSWGSRADTFVCDEPLYAHYLSETGVDHPGRDEVIARHDANWESVVNWLTGPVPQGKRVFYQKHMAHHLLPQIDRSFLSQLTHCFLIREPKEMLTSLMKVLPEPTLADTGLPQQIEILNFMQVHEMGAPPIVDARDILMQPKKMLTSLCERLGVAFDEAMLSWAPGIRETDGVWARYWYDAVAKTTTFGEYKSKGEEVPRRCTELLAKCEALYERLYSQRLTPESA